MHTCRQLQGQSAPFFEQALLCIAFSALCCAVQAIPRINSQGQLFGAVYKVASEASLKMEDSGQGPTVTVERMQYIEEGRGQ